MKRKNKRILYLISLILIILIGWTLWGNTALEVNEYLVLSGHAHGGQFRLPFIGGLVSPNQGIFPNYDAGLFSEENTTMIVSRVVGNSIIPVRFNNCPEIIVVELMKY